MAALAGDLIVRSPQGLYCPDADVHIDPWRSVPRAIITHAHADHARRGHGAYLGSEEGASVLKARLGDIRLQTLPYGEALRIGDAEISLHPAGHVLGSAQVRVAARGQVWVASGDYFCTSAEVEAADRASGLRGTCAPFEPVACQTFITESTFGLPLFRWRAAHEVMGDIRRWWADNASEGRISVLYGYSFGKAQRLLAGLWDGPGPLFVHAAVADMNRAYAQAGVVLPPWTPLPSSPTRGEPLPRHSLIVAPPSGLSQAWQRSLQPVSEAFASGWMHLRGLRRRQGLDRGFVLSDHADWPGLQRAIAATGAERVIVTHGYEDVMVRWLQQQGLQAHRLETPFGQEEAPMALASSGAGTSDSAATESAQSGDPTPTAD